MRFQCRIVGRRAVLLNGKVLQLDPQGVVDVTDEADIASLKAIPSEWTTTLDRRLAANAPDAPMLGAAEFLAQYMSDSAFRDSVDRFRTEGARQSFLAGQGFRFTTEELNAEIIKRDEAKKAEAVPEKPAVLAREEDEAPPTPAPPPTGKPSTPPAGAPKGRTRRKGLAIPKHSQ